MPDADVPQDLAALRNEIDRIDDQLHDLIMRRAEIVERVADVKGNSSALRPGREASILSRIVARHHGRFSVQVLIRIWREILAGTTSMQTDMAVTVVEPGSERSWLWDLARDHFGSSTPISVASTAMQAIRFVHENRATVAVVPWPNEQESDAWWRHLMTNDASALRIIARLPVADLPDHADRVALAVAQAPIEATSADRGMVAVEIDDDVSRSRLRGAFEGIGLKPLAMWTAPRSFEGKGSVEHLICTDGYVPGGDARYIRLEDALGGTLKRCHVVGGFAPPIKL